jgi:hypothetical protein
MAGSVKRHRRAQHVKRGPRARASKDARRSLAEARRGSGDRWLAGFLRTARDGVQ